MEEGGRGVSEVREVRVVGEGVPGSLESRLFLLGRMVVCTMLRNLPTVGSMSSGETERKIESNSSFSIKFKHKHVLIREFTTLFKEQVCLACCIIIYQYYYDTRTYIYRD